MTVKVKGTTSRAGFEQVLRPLTQAEVDNNFVELDQKVIDARAYTDTKVAAESSARVTAINSVVGAEQTRAQGVEADLAADITAIESDITAIGNFIAAHAVALSDLQDADTALAGRVTTLENAADINQAPYFISFIPYQITNFYRSGDSYEQLAEPDIAITIAHPPAAVASCVVTATVDIGELNLFGTLIQTNEDLVKTLEGFMYCRLQFERINNVGVVQETRTIDFPRLKVYGTMNYPSHTQDIQSTTTAPFYISNDGWPLESGIWPISFYTHARSFVCGIGDRIKVQMVITDLTLRDTDGTSVSQKIYIDTNGNTVVTGLQRAA